MAAVDKVDDVTGTRDVAAVNVTIGTDAVLIDCTIDVSDTVDTVFGAGATVADFDKVWSIVVL